MRTRPISIQQLEALSRFVHTLRPDWTKIRILEELDIARRDITEDVQLLSAAATAFACDTTQIDVFGLGSRGRHWRSWGLIDDHGNKISAGRAECGECGGIHATGSPCDPHAPPASREAIAAARAQLISRRTP